MTDNDERQRQAVAAKIELDQTEDAFAKVREGLIDQLSRVNTEQGAYRVAMSLQMLDAVQGILMARAQDLDVIEAERTFEEAQKG